MAKDWEMSQHEWVMFKQEQIMATKMQKYRYYCKCGHSVVILPRDDKTFCNWCGSYVFKNKLDEFKYRTQEQLNKTKRGMNI